MTQLAGKRDLIAAVVIPFVTNFDRAQIVAALAECTDADCEVYGDRMGANRVTFKSPVPAPDGQHEWEFTRINPGEFDPFKGPNRSSVAYWRFDSWYTRDAVSFAK